MFYSCPPPPPKKEETESTACACLDQLALELVSHQVHSGVQVVLALLHTHDAVPAGGRGAGGMRARMVESRRVTHFGTSPCAGSCAAPARPPNLDV